MALTLVSVASFLAMVLAWIVVPANNSPAPAAAPETAPRITSPQVAH